MCVCVCVCVLQSEVLKKGYHVRGMVRKHSRLTEPCDDYTH